MTTKTYGIFGRTQAIIRVPMGSTGKAFVEVEFARGNPQEGPNYRPATYTTNDPIMQRVMENSTLFGSLYKLYAVRHVQETQAAAPAAAKPSKPATGNKTEKPSEKIEKPSEKIEKPSEDNTQGDGVDTTSSENGQQKVPTATAVPDVTTRDAAIAYLKALGAKATDLRNNASILAYAEKIGVTFPNWK